MNIIQVFFGFLLIHVLFPCPTHADESSIRDLVGRIYQIGKTEGAPLFTQRTHYTKNVDGSTSVSSTIVDSNGKIALKEDAIYQGSKLLSQTVEQFQTGHRYSVSRKEGKIYFQDQQTTGAKKLSKGDVSETDNFISGPTTQPYLAEHWNELMDGKTVHCRFGVLESTETFGFNFKLKRKEVLDGRELVVISMKPSKLFSGLIFSLVEDSIEITMDPQTKRYARYKGLTPVQREDEKGKLSRFTAEIIYE